MLFLIFSFFAWANPSAGIEACDFGSLPESKWASHSTAEINWGPSDGARPRDSSKYLLRLDSGWRAKVKGRIKECPQEESQILQFLERANESCSLFLRTFQFQDESSVLGDLGLIASKTTGYKRELKTLEKKGCKPLISFLKQMEQLSESNIERALKKVSSDRCEELARKVDASRLEEKCGGEGEVGASGF